jgi:hypothetical protein
MGFVYNMDSKDLKTFIQIDGKAARIEQVINEQKELISKFAVALEDLKEQAIPKKSKIPARN